MFQGGAELLEDDQGGDIDDALLEVDMAHIGAMKQVANIADLALGMKKGSFFVSFTKRLASTDFQIVDHEMYKMSWGEVTVYIMQKMTDPKESKFALEKEGDDE